MEISLLLDQEAKALLRLKLKESTSSFDVFSIERLLDILKSISLVITQTITFINYNRITI